MSYTDALEKRIEWLKWSYGEEAEELYEDVQGPLKLYRYTLRKGETFFMNRRFCELVDYARVSVPDEMEFDPKWMPTKQGWMWMEVPFVTPTFTPNSETIRRITENLTDEERRELFPEEKIEGVRLTVAAIGWSEIPRGVTRTGDGKVIPEGSYEFACFANHAEVMKRSGMGFGMWSYFMLSPGEMVLDRLRQFEQRQVEEGKNEPRVGSGYQESRETDEYHEIRWVYTAFHLMSEKLSMQVEHRAERPTRRRIARENLPLPDKLRIVTLRRLEEARKEAKGEGEKKDWKWQWHVGGHWRNQFYPSENIHRTKWIEEYLKGPTDKPLKPRVHTLFKVER